MQENFFKIFFLMWTIFKVFIKFVTMLPLFYILVFWPEVCGIFPGGSDGKASACNAGDPGLIPGLGRSSGEGNGNPLQYSCLENLMDGAW